MTPDTEAEGLGPSPTAVSPAHISGVGPLPTEVDSEEEETPLHVGPKLVMVSPEPSSLGPDTIPVSGGLGPQPVVVSPEPANELPEGWLNHGYYMYALLYMYCTQCTCMYIVHFPWSMVFDVCLYVLL